MDEVHTIKVVRYVETNPVARQIGSHPQDWQWSTARARIIGGPDPLVGSGSSDLLPACAGWARFLAAGITEEDLEQIRIHQSAERPLGSAVFLARIETEIGRCVRTRPRGRPPREIRDSSIFDAGAELPWQD